MICLSLQMYLFLYFLSMYKGIYEFFGIYLNMYFMFILQVIVEINSFGIKESSIKPKPEDHNEQIPNEHGQKQGTKSLENYDEILTLTRHDTEKQVFRQTVVKHTDKEDDSQCNRHSFSLQRAWCCLKGRRSS